MATPNLQRIINDIRGVFGPTRVGVCNCRRTRLGGGRRGGWSHHAWCNAGDIYPDNTAQGHSMNEFLTINRDRLSVYQILWAERSTFTGNRVSDHWDHLHVVPWPYGIGTPPCKGGTLRVRHRDGSIGTSFDCPNCGVSQPEEEAMQVRELTAVLQSALIDAGYELGDFDGFTAPDGTQYQQGADGLMPVGGVSYGKLVEAFTPAGIDGSQLVTFSDLDEHAENPDAHHD